MTPAADTPLTQTLHASSVAIDGRALLILGPSGAGKSSLALQLMALGCSLVADDRTIVSVAGAGLVLSAPKAIRGRIEARGVGVLRADAVDGVPLHLIADLGTTETDRLPPDRRTTLMGIDYPLVHKVESSHFPAALLHYLRSGRSA